MPFRSLALLAVGFLSLTTLSSCNTIREVAALSQVNFSLDRVGTGALAGIPLDRVRSYNQLNATDVFRLTSAVSRGELPLSFTLFVGAENPATNTVNARLLQLDWTLLIDDKQTISGVFNQETLLPPGQPVDLPLQINLDLVEFFGNSLPDLFALAQALAGTEGSTSRIKLQAVPTVNTPIGPVQYPGALTIVSTTVGQ